MFFCFVLFFCIEVPRDDIKSAVHRLKSFARDAAQSGRALAQGVPEGSRGLASGGGCKGKAPPYLRKNFNELNIYNFGVGKGTTPLAKNIVGLFGELKICTFHPFSFKIYE